MDSSAASLSTRSCLPPWRYWSMDSCRCLHEVMIAWSTSASVRGPRFSTSRFLMRAVSRRITDVRSLSPDRSAALRSSPSRVLSSTDLLRHQPYPLLGLLARSQHLLLPADTRLFVVLPLAELGKHPGLLTLLLEAA